MSRRSGLRRTLPGLVVVAALTMVVIGSPIPASPAAHATLRTQQGGSCYGLRGVTATSATNAWAVSYNGCIKHWNGTAWKIVKSPAVSGLNDVDALSASNAWAVGSGTNLVHGEIPAPIEHWNGTAWKTQKVPTFGNYYSELDGVVAVSRSNVWAAGYYGNESTHPYKTLVEHWSGTGWKVVRSPNLGTSQSWNGLGGLAALSPTNIWAVGGGGFNSHGSALRTLVEHWNGTKWRVVKSPSVGGQKNVLNDVAAISPSNIWAVGYYADGSGRSHTLIEHWKGSAWRVVKSPRTGATNDVGALSAVTAVSASDVWAVGYAGHSRTLIEHWNGTAWRAVKSPNVGTHGCELVDVAAVSRSDIWADGSSNSNAVSRPLIEHWNGTTWKVT